MFLLGMIAIWKIKLKKLKIIKNKEVYIIKKIIFEIIISIQYLIIYIIEKLNKKNYKEKINYFKLLYYFLSN